MRTSHTLDMGLVLCSLGCRLSKVGGTPKSTHVNFEMRALCLCPGCGAGGEWRGGAPCWSLGWRCPVRAVEGFIETAMRLAPALELDLFEWLFEARC